MTIEKILCNPPLVIARLGGSAQPVDAYQWVASSDPHVTGETMIRPAWTLDVQPDGRVRPRMPNEIHLRDVEGIRPVAPFIEIWCVLSGDNTPQPLTEDILKAEGLELRDISFTIDAVNRKAARRTLNDDLAYGTFPPLVIRGDDHQAHEINAVSPRSVVPQQRLIPDSSPIRLGRFQVIRPTDSSAPRPLDWPDSLNLNTIRIRFTPPRGEFYGPANQAGPDLGVPNRNAFLNGSAGWFGAQVIPAFAQPADTFAGAENRVGNRLGSSLGIVDDTCDARLTVNLNLGQGRNQKLFASANIFSGPSDFSPDRRPFFSLSDSLLDRDADHTARNAAMSPEEQNAWVEDLFERIYEHVALMNVDYWRNRLASTIPQGERRATLIPNDETSEPERSMGGLDPLRDEAIALAGATLQDPLPVTQRARERHRNLSDIHELESFVRRAPNRLEELIRKPFQEANEGFTMKMPAFMRGSNAQPLTLTVSQYDLLMSWVNGVLSQPESAPPAMLAAAVGITETAARELSARASARRGNVLAGIDINESM